MTLPTTISQYDITIDLPKKYEKDQLSFEPSRDTWTVDKPGKTYTLKPVSKNLSTIWIAFPNPSQGGFHTAQIVTSLLIGLFLLFFEGKIALERKLGQKALIATLVLTVSAIAATVYFTFTLSNPLQFLAWVAGLLIPLVFAPFICTWQLIATHFEAEVFGKVTIGGEPAKYVKVSLLVIDENGEEKLRKQVNVKLDGSGSYQIFVLCGNSTHQAGVSVSASGTHGGRSANFEFSSNAPVHVPIINIERIEIPDHRVGHSTTNS